MSNLVWIELDRAAPESNLSEIRRGCAPGVMVCAVVKANAYGHGVSQMVRLLPSADCFAVNSLAEGLHLRREGITRPVILLGHVPLADLEEALEADLDLTVYNKETVERIASLHPKRGPARVHIKVETGTGRQGVLIDDLKGFLNLVAKAGNITLQGLSTHFANIEDTLNHDYAELQLSRFQEALAVTERIAGRPPLIHTACSAAALLFPETHFTMLRVGISLYGIWPSREAFLFARMKGSAARLSPVLAWKTRIAQIKVLAEGSCVGYGCSHRTTRTTVLGVLPVGYSDGYDRNLGNRAHVLVRGQRAPVIGRICMNLTMVDLTDVHGAALEEEVVLLGRSADNEVTAEMMAEWAHTISYEIVSRINPLLPRRIVEKV
jgi:alanine racemase